MSNNANQSEKFMLAQLFIKEAAQSFLVELKKVMKAYEPEEKTQIRPERLELIWAMIPDVAKDTQKFPLDTQQTARRISEVAREINRLMSEEGDSATRQIQRAIAELIDFDSLIAFCNQVQMEQKYRQAKNNYLKAYEAIGKEIRNTRDMDEAKENEVIYMRDAYELLGYVKTQITRFYLEGDFNNAKQKRDVVYYFQVIADFSDTVLLKEKGVIGQEIIPTVNTNINSTNITYHIKRAIQDESAGFLNKNFDWDSIDYLKHYVDEALNYLSQTKDESVLAKLRFIYNELSSMNRILNLSVTAPDSYSDNASIIFNIDRYRLNSVMQTSLESYRDKTKAKLSYWLSKHIGGMQSKKRVYDQVGQESSNENLEPLFGHEGKKTLLEVLKSEGAFSQAYLNKLYETVDEVDHPNSALSLLCRQHVSSFLYAFLKEPHLSQEDENLFKEVIQKTNSQLASLIVLLDDKGDTSDEKDVNHYIEKKFELFRRGDTFSDFFHKLWGKFRDILPFNGVSWKNKHAIEYVLLSDLKRFLKQTHCDRYEGGLAQFYTDAIIRSTQVYLKIESLNLASNPVLESIKRIQRGIFQRFVKSENVRVRFSDEQLKDIYAAVLQTLTQEEIEAHWTPLLLKAQHAYFQKTSGTKQLLEERQAKHRSRFELSTEPKHRQYDTGSKYLDRFSEQLSRNIRFAIKGAEAIEGGAYSSNMLNITTIGKSIQSAGSAAQNVLGIPFASTIAGGASFVYKFFAKNTEKKKIKNIATFVPEQDLNLFVSELTKLLAGNYQYLINTLDSKSIDKFSQVIFKLILEKIAKGDLKGSTHEKAQAIRNYLLTTDHKNQGTDLYLFNLKTSLTQNMNGVYQSGPNAESALSKAPIMIVKKEGEYDLLVRPGYTDIKNGYAIVKEEEIDALVGTARFQRMSDKSAFKEKYFKEVDDMKSEVQSIYKRLSTLSRHEESQDSLLETGEEVHTPERAPRQWVQTKITRFLDFFKNDNPSQRNVVPLPGAVLPLKGGEAKKEAPLIQGNITDFFKQKIQQSEGVGVGRGVSLNVFKEEERLKEETAGQNCP